jgi:hypothetical protein
MTDKNTETHYTCTSTTLDKTLGSRPEHINMDVLNRLHEEQTNTPISSDLAVARIQREQAIMRHKREERESK